MILLGYLVFGQVSLAAAQNMQPRQTAMAYLHFWQAGEYSAMYDMLSEQSKNYVSKTDFISWHQEFRDKYIIERFEITGVENQSQTASVEYRLQLTAIGGTSKARDCRIRLIKEAGSWSVEYQLPETAQGHRPRPHVA